MSAKIKMLLVCYGAVKAVLVALFIVSLNVSNPALAKEPIVCSGKNLIEEYSRNQPELLADLQEKAKKVMYGNARLWRISKSGIADSWVFGTMHLAEDSISHMPAQARGAFDQSDTVLVEITDMLDPKKAQETVLKLKHLTFRLDGSTIRDDLNAEQMKALEKAIALRALPFEVAIRMQPWMLAPAISNQLCEIIAKQQGKLFLDARVVNLAVESGKTLIALETTEEQLVAISSLPEEFQITTLIETLELGDRLDDIKETVKALYINGDISMIIPFIRHVSAQSVSGAGYAEFTEKLVVARNIKMAERAAEHFAKGNVFMAIGALHLPGETGIVSLLKAQGYQVTAIDTLLLQD